MYATSRLDYNNSGTPLCQRHKRHLFIIVVSMERQILQRLSNHVFFFFVKIFIFFLGRRGVSARYRVVSHLKWHEEYLAYQRIQYTCFQLGRRRVRPTSYVSTFYWQHRLVSPRRLLPPLETAWARLHLSFVLEWHYTMPWQSDYHQ